MTLTNQKWHFGMMFVCHFGLKYGKCLVEIFLHPPTPASGSPMALSWFLWVILAGLAATIASICEFHLLVFTVTDMCLFYLPSGMDVLTVLLALICTFIGGILGMAYPRPFRFTPSHTDASTQTDWCLLESALDHVYVSRSGSCFHLREACAQNGCTTFSLLRRCRTCGGGR